MNQPPELFLWKYPFHGLSRERELDIIYKGGNPGPTPMFAKAAVGDADRAVCIGPISMGGPMYYPAVPGNQG